MVNPKAELPLDSLTKPACPIVDARIQPNLEIANSYLSINTFDLHKIVAKIQKLFICIETVSRVQSFCPKLRPCAL